MSDGAILLVLVLGVIITLIFVFFMIRLQRKYPEQMKNAADAMGCLELILSFFRR